MTATVTTVRTCRIEGCRTQPKAKAHMCSKHHYQRYQCKVPLEEMRADCSYDKDRYRPTPNKRYKTHRVMLDAAPLLEFVQFGWVREAIEFHERRDWIESNLRTARERGTVQLAFVDEFLIGCLSLWPYAVYEEV